LTCICFLQFNLKKLKKLEFTYHHPLILERNDLTLNLIRWDEAFIGPVDMCILPAKSNLPSFSEFEVQLLHLEISRGGGLTVELILTLDQNRLELMTKDLGRVMHKFGCCINRKGIFLFFCISYSSREFLHLLL
jgi:hypothetical protein